MEDLQALLATPMVVLEAKGVSREGLGRLCYKWLDAFHEYWCVFLPHVCRVAWLSWRMYCQGTRMESLRTLGRVKLFCEVVWTMSGLGTYALFYGVLFPDEGLEWACQGFLGMILMLVIVTCGWVDDNARTLEELVAAYCLLVVLYGSVLCLNLISRVWQSYESVVDGRSPLDVARNGYNDWCKALEEQEQAERLSEAFWRMNRGEDQPRVQVRTRSGLQAERRALRAKREAARVTEPRRGRRVSVGEDVPSRNGGYRLGTDEGQSEAACTAIELMTGDWGNEIPVEALF
ncbi:unnamed protein product [Phytophthora fragariaefolia]|uniref:Unnamed protein product n=1 Tax=Phytophthora fragariaefolia TaxID=1490495 RepID=A0A9W6XNQ2_9STRA|nr:unnamed protein product [Phytophthora fragariaefolia]